MRPRAWAFHRQLPAVLLVLVAQRVLVARPVMVVRRTPVEQLVRAELLVVPQPVSHDRTRRSA
jgi:hypothetical protein